MPGLHDEPDQDQPGLASTRNPGLIAGRNEFSLDESRQEPTPQAKGLLSHPTAQRVKVDDGMSIDEQ